MVDFQSLEEEVSGFVQLIQPTKQSNDARRKVYEYFKGLVDQRCKELLILPTGSSCSRTYLPDGDLDLIVVSRNSQSEEVSQPQQQQLLSLGRLFSVLTEEISLKENGIVENNRFTIRNVEFVNARTKLLHCRVNNIGVDITFHQISGIVALYFIEKVNKIVGRANLFKRSLLLVKSWCLNESVIYGGGPAILGAKEGMLSSYAVSVLVTYLFNKFGKDLQHPLQVLHLFLHFYQFYPWETHVLTLEGPKFIQTSSVSSSQVNTGREYEKQFSCDNRFLSAQETVLRKYSELQVYTTFSGLEGLMKGQSDAKRLFQDMLSKFPLRACNIQDPTDPTNNLGYSVPRNNLPVLSRSMMIGYQAMENVFFRLHQVDLLRQQSFHQDRRKVPQFTIPQPFTNQFSVALNGKKSQKNQEPRPSSVTGDPSTCLLPSHNNPFQPIVPVYSIFPSAPNLYSNKSDQVRETGIKSYSRSPSVDNDTNSSTPPSTPSPPLTVPPLTVPRTHQDSHLSPFLFELFPNSLRKYVLSGNLRSDLLDHPLQFIQHKSTRVSSEESMVALEGDAESALNDLLHAQIQKEVELPSTESKEVKTVLVNEIKASEDITSLAPPDSRHEVASPPSIYPQISEPIAIEDSGLTSELSLDRSGVKQDVDIPNPVKLKNRKKRSSTDPATMKNLLLQREAQQNLNKIKENTLTTSRETDVQLSSWETTGEPLNRRFLEELCDWVERQLRVYYYPLLICFVASMIAAVLCFSSLTPSPHSQSLHLLSLLVSPPKNKSNGQPGEPISQGGGGNVLLEEVIHSLIALSSTSRLSSTQASEEDVEATRIIGEVKPGEEEVNEVPLKSTETHLATHWVQVGDSITFGDFTLFADYIETGSYPISTAQYLWTKDGRNVSKTIQPFFSIEESSFVDGGHYRCYKLLSSHQMLLLTESIVRISKRPRIRNRPFYHEAKLGKTLILNLDVEGVPPPNFRWFRNGYLLADQIQHSLVIDRAERFHAGTYSCEVSNIAGKFVWLEATVSVTD